MSFSARLVRLTLVGSGTSLILLCSVPAAGAYRPATRAQRHAIRRVVVKRWQADATVPCPIGASDKFKFLGASISTADARFAEANVNETHVPETVLRDFGIEGQLSGHGGFGPC